MVIRFGSFRLIPAQRQLSRAGVPVPIGTRAMDLLLFLVDRAGTVVSRRSLMDAVWANCTVVDNNLSVNMVALRRVLGNGPDGQPLIQTVPGRGYVFVAKISASEEAATGGRFRAAHAEAMPPRLIGREDDAVSLGAKIKVHRMVSIVGFGGVGKTALAFHLAATQSNRRADGPLFIDLSTATEAADVMEALAIALDGRADTNATMEQIVARLADRPLLLVLDNCEQAVEGVATVAEALLQACPRLRILATSRETLGVRGECVYRLGPLALPPRDQPVSAQEALKFSAVRLFAESAAILVGFKLDDSNVASVAKLCHQLDGVPLAIEMAVARLRVLPPAELAGRLDKRFQFLTGARRHAPQRHRSLQATMDWSYRLLSDQERSFLRDLSVFADGASLSSIAAVITAGTTADLQMIDRLSTLADKSLLSIDHGPVARLRMLETTRHYARAKAAELRKPVPHRRHAAHFADLSEIAALAWPVTSGPEWLSRHGPDLDNLRTALAWSFGADGDPDLGLRLAASTVPLWWELAGSHLAEGQEWLARAEQLLCADTPEPLRGRIKFGLSWTDLRIGDRHNAEPALEAANLLANGGDSVGEAAARWRAASALLSPDSLVAAEEQLLVAERILRDRQAGKWLALTLIRLADLRVLQGRSTAALASYREALALSRKLHFWIGLASGSSSMAELLLAIGQSERALQQLKEARDELPACRRTPLMSTLASHLLVAGDTSGMRMAAGEVITQGCETGLASAVAWTVEASALVAAGQGSLLTAARLAGYARYIHPSLEMRRGAHKLVADRLYEKLSSGLSAEDFDSALTEGGSWPLHVAAERARLVLLNNV